MVIYFSATGNSKYCAEKIAKATDDRLFSLNDAMKKGQFEIDIGGNSQLVIVSPIYDMGMSWAIKEYLESADFVNVSGNCYICAVFTCGKSCGIAAEEMKEVFRKKGLSLNAAYAVCMPDNYIPMFPLVSKEKQKEILDKAERTIKTVISKIQNHDSAFEMPPAMPKPMAKLIRKINIPKQKKTDHFWVKDSCNGCHLCEQICPMNIITTNIAKSAMEKATDLEERRIYDRILVACAPMRFNGENFRKTEAAETMKTASELLNS